MLNAYGLCSVPIHDLTRRYWTKKNILYPLIEPVQLEKREIVVALSF